MDSTAKQPAGATPGAKTAKALGLFLAAVLVLTPGCGGSGDARSGHTHIDRNNDGYCDEDGEPMPAAGGSRYHGGYYGGYYGLPHFGGGSTVQRGPGHPAGITGGAAPRGGIGSSHFGGGG